MLILCNLKLKRVKRIVFIPLFILVALLYQRCSTDVELNEIGAGTPVIYGLLDQNETYHFIRINKTFVGQGNALDFALVRDSSEYDPSLVDAKIEEYVNGTLTRSWTLMDTVLQNRPADGEFYSPEYTAYYFVEPSLNQAATYKLVADIGTENNKKTVTAETGLVDDFNIQSPVVNYPPGTPQLNINFYGGGIYKSIVVKYTSSAGAKRYNLSLALNYDEVNGSVVTPRVIEWNLGDKKTSGVEGNEQIETSVSGEGFYTYIASKIASDPVLNDPGITKRIFRGIDFIVAAASEDLNTYMELNEPVTGIVQERPAFTNVNNGIGLFSARYSKTVEAKWLNYESLKQLNNGIYTSPYLFCVDTSAYVGEIFYCP